MKDKAQTGYADVFVFAGLLCASAVYLAFLPDGRNAAGLLMVFWGVFVFLRIFWIRESLTSESGQENAPPALPRRLLNLMYQKQNMKEAGEALRAVDRPFMIWLGLGALYILCGLLSDFFPHLPEKYTAVNDLIAAFFTDQGRDVSISDGLYFREHIVNYSLVCIVAFSVWVVRTYSFYEGSGQNAGRDYTRFLLRVTLGLFGLLMLSKTFTSVTPLFADAHVPVSWRGAGWARFNILQEMNAYGPAPSCMEARLAATGWFGSLCLYIAALIPLTLFIRCLKARTPSRKYMIAGVCAFVFMAFYDIFMPCAEWSIALWLLLWSFISVVWMIARAEMHK